MKATIKDLKAAYSLIKNIPNLNYGGCLYAAYGVYLHLVAKGFKNVNIVQLDYDNSAYIRTNKSYISNKSNNVTSGMHFGVSINNGKTVYDTDGLCIYAEKLVIPFEFTTKFAINSLKYGTWNPKFDQYEIRSINKALDTKLKFYKAPYGKIPTEHTSYAYRYSLLGI